MTRAIAMRLALLAPLAAALSGCVVAAAFPIAAAGSMLKTGDGDAEVRAPAPDEAKRVPALTAYLPPSTEPAPTGQVARIVPLAELPPPGAIERQGQAAKYSYDTFYGYALAQAARDPIENARESALLATPGSLAPDRLACGIQPPAVLVDLDPARGLFSPDKPPPANGKLANTLAALRAQDIAVFWLSGASAAEAGAVKRTLRTLGLDSQGRDEILLMRYPSDDKQLRRRAIAETNCLVAILGDERADFDELYSFLKTPDAAAPLEAMVGRGWFLIPELHS